MAIAHRTDAADGDLIPMPPANGVAWLSGAGMANAAVAPLYGQHKRGQDNPACRQMADDGQAISK